MIQLTHLDVTGTATGPKRPWDRMSMRPQNHVTARDSKDAVRVLEGSYGKRAPGTLKTNRKTGHRECQFKRDYDGFTIYVHASWFEDAL